ncbi:MAG TPA: 2-hydroxyacyl-CoA dehydratase [Planctomycetota bacterium]|nr:2-hydroxyacyl-CoA dehydratase [Planctomycetota bacterium]
MTRPNPTDRRVGITTTVPSEVIFAAGLVPVDLNNLFMSAPRPEALVEEAEQAGFPRNCCAWIKGIYAACRREKVRRLVGVVRGDCSNTLALMEVLRSEGVETIEFAYPHEPRPELVAGAIESFAASLGTTTEAAQRQRRRLEPARRLLAEVDELAGARGTASAADAHLWMISASDFRGDPESFERDLASFLAPLRAAPPRPGSLPVVLAGVPPIKSGLFAELERLGVRVAYDEMPYEFTMARARSMPLETMYAEYIYPYDIERRVARLREAARSRAARGVIHYVQSFCYRQIQDRLLREGLGLPVLTLECDRPGPLDAGAMTRLEAFVESLRR